jgi:hypothetical protein
MEMIDAVYRSDCMGAEVPLDAEPARRNAASTQFPVTTRQVA